jgi:hypothetical protein
LKFTENLKITPLLLTFENDFLELNTGNDEEAAAVVVEFSHEYWPELRDDDQEAEAML